MRQLLVELPPDTTSPWPMTAPQRHRLQRVLRLPDGAPLWLTDGRGHRILVRLRGAEFVPQGPVEALSPAPRPLALACGLLKGERWDWLVEKAVELGATALQPLACDHCVVQVEPRKQTVKVERWQALADGALEQCGRPWACTVATPLSVADWLTVANRGRQTVLWCDEQAGAAPLGEVLATVAHRGCVLAVAPEGGWSTRERMALEAAGATAVALSDAVLRAETAALAALAIAAAGTARLATL
jgi:16S rRNA (uracil1498-N3)-methyltransferase